MKFLYHGSKSKIIGRLKPQKSDDLGDNPDEKHTAVYATDSRGLAIGYAMLGGEGVELAGLDDRRKRPPYAIYYIGFPKKTDRNLYIYKLPSESFGQVKGEPHEFYSLQPVKPVSFEVVKMKDYMHYARKSKDWRPKATKEDKEWMKKKRNE